MSEPCKDYFLQCPVRALISSNLDFFILSARLSVRSVFYQFPYLFLTLGPETCACACAVFSLFIATFPYLLSLTVARNSFLNYLKNTGFQLGVPLKIKEPSQEIPFKLLFKHRILARIPSKNQVTQLGIPLYIPFKIQDTSILKGTRGLKERISFKTSGL